MKLKNIEEIRRLIAELPTKYRRIFSIIAHIDHGKSTTADFLLKRAGLISGQADSPAISYDPQEIDKEITIFTSVITLKFEEANQDYLFQINDTPGHLSFTGEVSRALRASDGVIVIVDALEGIMIQTETNMQLAIADELCKPVLFINKVDRLLGELQLTPDEIYQRLDRIVANFNQQVKQLVPVVFDPAWLVSFRGNSVAVGSSKDGWGFTVEILKEKGLTPSQVFEHYYQHEIDWLRTQLPLDEVLLRMVIQHLPSPDKAQLYKIPKIWQGTIPDEYVHKELVKRQLIDQAQHLGVGLRHIFQEHNLI